MKAKKNENETNVNELKPDLNENEMTKQNSDLEENEITNHIEAEKPDVNGLVDEIIQLRLELDAANDNYLRALAELDNFRKRVDRKIQDDRHSLAVQFLQPFFDAIDDLNRLEKASRESFDHDVLLQGLDLIANKLKVSLANFGVEPIKDLGEMFNPNLHEVLMAIETDAHPAGTIVDVFSAGYNYNGRLLRPAKVIIAKEKETNNNQLDDNQKENV
jgi:molecular chaperone GrpE